MIVKAKFLAVVCFTAVSMLGFFSNPGAAEETYLYERMWPSLQQPWYFDPYDIAMDANRNIYLTDSINERVVKLNAEGQFITEWKSGDDFGLPWSPTGIAIGDDQYVYVADQRHSCIKKFTLNAEYIGQWGDPGSEEGQFKFKDYDYDHDGGYIAVDAVGNVYVADTMNHRIQKFNPDGEFIKKWGSLGSGDGEFNGPAALVIDADGYLYVVDGFNDRIQKFTTDGVFVKTWGSHGDQPGEFNFWQHPQENYLGSTGIAIDNAGNIVVVDNENYRIQTFDPEGNFLSLWQGRTAERVLFDSPGGILVDPTGNIYVADGSKKIYKFTADGTLLTQWGSSGTGQGQFRKPLGIGVDASGNVYVGDISNFRIQKFTAAGQFLSQTDVGGDNYWQPWGMAVDGDGTVYAVGVSALYAIEDCEHSVKKFNPSGALVTEWGEYGSGPGQFMIWEKPTDVALDGDGNVYVVDTGNDRIQKFSPDGTFITAWGSHGTGVGQFDFLQNYGAGIAVDQVDQTNGWVYVVGGGNGRVQKFDLNGTSLLEWNTYGDPAEELLVIQAVTVDNDGNVLVDFSHPPFESSYSGGIMKFSPAGDFIAEYLELGSSPGQVYQPHDMAVDATGRLYISEDNYNRIQAFKTVTTPPNTKSIIVNGGGPYVSNDLWDATQMSANFAYRTLTYQGFTKGTIHYLTPDTDLDLDANGESDDVDGDATNANLQDAITNWASDADSLVIYLIDHGGDGIFRMSDNETLSAADLDTWLDTLQATMSGRVTVIYEACESGSFISLLTPPVEKERVVITSTSPGESAYFISQGSISFSSYFWTHVFNGVNLDDAFNLAAEAIGYATPNQNPLLDANGDGIANQAEDFTLIQNTYIGNGATIYGDVPFIGSISEDQTISGTSSTLLYAADVTDSDGIARVWAVIRSPDFNLVSSDNPVQELPSVDLMPVDGTPGRYETTYNDFNIEGTYQIAIYARDRLGNTSIPEITTVSVGNPLRRRAIIVAGGSSGDDLWSALDKITTLAYGALTFQGYSDDDIYFMSPVSVTGVDGSATLENLEYAVKNWPGEDTQDLVLYLVGNGGAGTFEINATETLHAADLDAWLDLLQATLPGKVTVIYDACRSGSFLAPLIPPDGKERILVSSAGDDQAACFLVGGDISFSKFFWQKILNGATIRDSFLQAKSAVSFSYQDQVSLLDDTGNGIGNEKTDGSLARYYRIGFGIMLAGDDPLIGSIVPELTVGEGASVTIWVEDVTTTGTIDKVWAVLTPPDYDPNEPNNPVIDLPTIELIHVGSNRYEGNFTDLTAYGTHQVTVYAMDIKGNISLPMETSVCYVVCSDDYEEDDSYAQATIIAIDNQNPQQHNFHDSGDADWVKFYALNAETYAIGVKNSGTNCDAVIEIYDTDGTTWLASMDNVGKGEDETLYWTCTQDGVYYVKIIQYGPYDFGENTTYDLQLTIPAIPIAGWIKGLVFDALTGEPISGALIETSQNLSAISFSSGGYLMIHPAGTFTLSAKSSGYDMSEYPNFVINEGAIVTKNINLTPSIIDSDGDTIPDIEDNCPDISNPNQTDSDGDNVGDVCDNCLSDPNKTEPGICGCGVADTDTDSDGTSDCNDDCPNDPDKIEAGICGCGIPDTDSDQDGSPDCNDGCPSDPNKAETGICGCGLSETDTDSDGTPDCIDNCPNDPNKTQPGVCGCGIADTDSDNDGTPDCNDNCPDDPNKTEPGDCGCDLADIDSDMDQILDCHDNFPNDPIAKGDINNDGNVNLIDIIFAVQVMTGLESSSTIYKQADVNGDNKIGLEDGIYILREISELR